MLPQLDLCGKNKAALELINATSKVSNFDELYSFYGFEYVIVSSGILVGFPAEYFDAVFSVDVLEHVSRDSVSCLIQEIGRVLKYGGYSTHELDLGDHLQSYDRKLHKKHYLRYTEKVWKSIFENNAQYFNMIQRPDWLSLFSAAGF